MTQEERRSLASYVLGALAPAERRELDEHLASCPECREELASYAGLPGLLSRLDLAEATGGTLLPPPSLLSSTLAAVESERTARSRQLSRWRAATAAVAVAAAVTGFLALPGSTISPEPERPQVSTGGTSSQESERPLVAATGVSSSGTVSMQPRPWGTQLHLRMQGLPLSGDFEAYAVDAAGVRTLVASWSSTADGRAKVPAATPLSAEELARIVVQTRRGSKLVLTT